MHIRAKRRIRENPADSIHGDGPRDLKRSIAKKEVLKCHSRKSVQQRLRNNQAILLNELTKALAERDGLCHTAAD